MLLVINIPDNYNLSDTQNGNIAGKIILNAAKNCIPLSDILSDIKNEIIENGAIDCDLKCLHGQSCVTCLQPKDIIADLKIVEKYLTQ